MAEEQQNSDTRGKDFGDNKDQLDQNGGKNLEEFITHHYQQQKKDGRFDATEIPEERTNNFFARAIAESQRMSAEVCKSEEKRQKLHSEFGSANFTAWQTEHASEVLLPHQMEAVGLAVPNQQS